jgi:riboflavin kinase / FMN adenylyltransferase
MIYSGIVQEGEKRGRALGYPTANIPLEASAVSGVYAAVVTFREKKYPSAVFADQRRKILEAHLLDFSDDMYGEEIVVDLLKKIRENQSFKDDVTLREMIAQDITTIRRQFS